MRWMETARKIIFICCSVCCAGCCIFLAVWFVNGQLVKQRNRELAERFHAVEYLNVEPDQNGNLQQEKITQPDIKRQMDALRQENEDTGGWIQIAGTGIDYPVVQGDDNDYYLNRNFWKQEDRYGAIFMDSANADSFASRHVILYGHNMKDGAMFGELTRYLDADYLSGNPVIDVILPDGSTISYRIFAARKTNAYDSAYRKDFADETEFADFAAGLGAPDASAPLLTLSTCTNGADYTERILVHAVRELAQQP